MLRFVLAVVLLACAQVGVCVRTPGFGLEVAPAKSQICIFHHFALRSDEYRKRALAVLSTWGRPGSTIVEGKEVVTRYLIDPTTAHLLNYSLPKSQVLPWVEPTQDEQRFEMERAVVQSVGNASKRLQCQWIIIAEDDAYMNVPLVASKLLRIGPPKEPTMMGAVYNSSRGPFIHGSVFVMSIQAMSLLAQTLIICPPHEGYGDVSLAMCLQDIHGVDREKALPYSHFGCEVYDNAGVTTLSQAEALSDPECKDWFHKLSPGNMTQLHSLLSGRKCKRSMDELMLHCGVTPEHPTKAQPSSSISFVWSRLSAWRLQFGLP